MNRESSVPPFVMANARRAWAPGVLGAATSDAGGGAAFTAAEVTDLPGCWGTVLDYVLLVHDPAGVFADDSSATTGALSPAPQAQTRPRAVPTDVEGLAAPAAVGEVGGAAETTPTATTATLVYGPQGMALAFCLGAAGALVAGIRIGRAAERRKGYQSLDQDEQEFQLFRF